MAEVLVDPNENAKCGQLKGDLRFGCCSSLDGRRLGFIKFKDFWLLDLFHMTKKKFYIFLDCLPTILQFGWFQALHWFHENKALVVIMVLNEQTQMEESHSAIMDIDHDRSHCVLRDVHSLNEGLDRRENHHSCKIFSLFNGVSIVWIGYPGDQTATILDVFTNSDDGEPKWTKRTLLPDKFCPMRAIDGFIFGFLLVNDYNINPSKLVKICMETNEQTTVDVVSPVKSARFSKYHSWVQVGRKLITSCDAKASTRNTYRQRILIFDIDSLRWSQWKCEFKGMISELICDGDNTLIVMTGSRKSRRRCDLTYKFYRFSINRPDTLANSSWMAIRNHAKKSPGFDRHVLTLLPKNSPFHCTLSTLPSIEGPSSSSRETSVPSKKNRV